MTKLHSIKLNENQTPLILQKELYSTNQQGSVSKSVSGFPCFLIGYLFIDNQSLSNELVTHPVAFVAVKWKISPKLIPNTLLFRDA